MAGHIEQLDMTLGAAVRALRRDHRLTQFKLAELANVSLGALKNLEKGRGSSTTTLLRVVHALGQDDWLELLRPARPTFNPLDLVDQRQSARPTRRRVRHDVNR